MTEAESPAADTAAEAIPAVAPAEVVTKDGSDSKTADNITTANVTVGAVTRPKI